MKQYDPVNAMFTRFALPERVRIYVSQSLDRDFRDFREQLSGEWSWMHVPKRARREMVEKLNRILTGFGFKAKFQRVVPEGPRGIRSAPSRIALILVSSSGKRFKW